MTLSPFLKTVSSTKPCTTEFAVVGEIVKGSDAPLVNEFLPRVREASIQLNLSAVERIDAAGIAALITLYCTALQAGNQFSLIEPSHHVLALLQLVGLDQFLVRPRNRKEAPCDVLSFTAA